MSHQDVPKGQLIHLDFQATRLDRDRWKREALAARNLLRFYGVLVQPLSKTDREARATLYRKARAANTPERTTQHEE